MQGLLQEQGRFRLLMLAAIALSALSQFYIAIGPSGEMYPMHPELAGSWSGTADAAINALPAMTGWRAHPQAYIVLPILAAAFFVELKAGVWGTRLLCVVALAALLWCSTPLEWAPGGGGMAITFSLCAGLLAVVAVVVGWRSAGATHDHLI